jgi:hypothetical protein
MIRLRLWVFPVSELLRLQYHRWANLLVHRGLNLYDFGKLVVVTYQNPQSLISSRSEI